MPVQNTQPIQDLLNSLINAAPATSRTQVLADTQGLNAAAVRDFNNTIAPQIQGAVEGAGTSASALSALLAQNSSANLAANVAKQQGQMLLDSANIQTQGKAANMQALQNMLGTITGANTAATGQQNQLLINREANTAHSTDLASQLAASMQELLSGQTFTQGQNQLDRSATATNQASAQAASLAELLQQIQAGKAHDAFTGGQNQADRQVQQILGQLAASTQSSIAASTNATSRANTAATNRTSRANNADSNRTARLNNTNPLSTNKAKSSYVRDVTSPSKHPSASSNNVSFTNFWSGGK